MSNLGINPGNSANESIASRFVNFLRQEVKELKEEAGVMLEQAGAALDDLRVETAETVAEAEFAFLDMITDDEVILQEVINEINKLPEVEKLDVFSELVDELLDEGEFASAAKVISQIPNSTYKITAILDLNQKLKTEGQYLQAIELDTKYGFGKVLDNYIAEINSFTDTDQKISTFSDLAKMLINEGEFDSAAKVISNIPNRIFKTMIVQVELKPSLSEQQGLYNDLKTKYGLFETLNEADTKIYQEEIARREKTNQPSIYDNLSLKNVSESAGNIARAAFDFQGQRSASKGRGNINLNRGRLACAHTVSMILEKGGISPKVYSAECNMLANNLEREGFSRIAGNGPSVRRNNQVKVSNDFDFKPGDVVFFPSTNRRKPVGYGHVGIISRVENGRAYMVHNSSSRLKVMEVPLRSEANRDGYSMPVAVYRKNA